MNKFTLGARVREALTNANLRFFSNDEDTVFLLLYDTRRPVSLMIIRVICEDDHCMVRGEIPVAGGDEVMDEIIRYVTMANYGLPVGSFQINLKNGDVIFKNYINTRELDDISEEQLVNAVRLTVNTAERYAAGIANIAVGSATAEEEISKAEKKA